MDVDVEVYWKDGVSDKRKIIYIPQSWLNRVVDKSSKDAQLNGMIEELLLQQDKIAEAHIHLKARIAEITTETRKNIIDYVAAREKVQACEKNFVKPAEVKHIGQQSNAWRVAAKVFLLR